MDRIAARWPWVMALAAVALLGCGGDWATRYIDPAVAERVEWFEQRTGHKVISSIVLASMPSGAVSASAQGRCVAEDGERPVIYISDLLGGHSLDAVLWHEIGHCDLGIPHAPPEQITIFPVENGPLPVLIAPATIMAADLTAIVVAMEYGYSEFYLCSLGLC